VICENGQTQKASRRLDPCNILDQREGLGRIQSSSSINGAEQIRPDQINCPGQDPTRGANEQGKTTAGKILERLELIENAHLSYVKGHQQRLEARLSESKEEEEQFRKAVQDLKQEIYNLVSEKTEENSE
jgi:hypothetical protein